MMMKKKTWREREREKEREEERETASLRRLPQPSGPEALRREPLR